MSDREEFEKWIDASPIVEMGTGARAAMFAAYKAGMKAARAQQAGIGEAAAWAKHFDGQLILVEGPAFLTEDALSRSWRPLVYADTHPQPAQKGSVPDGSRGSCQNCETDWENPANPGQICDACLEARAQPNARQGRVPNGWRVEHREGDPSSIHIYRDSDGAWCGGGIEGDDGGAGLRYEFLSALISAAPQPAHCRTCNDNGMIGGPSYAQPDEGGEPCPDCNAPRTEGLIPGSCELGIHGKAYDGPSKCRAYTYAYQPDNLTASILGGVTLRAYKDRAGDSIDRGLCLLDRLESEGFGVFEFKRPNPPAEGAE